MNTTAVSMPSVTLAIKAKRMFNELYMHGQKSRKRFRKRLHSYDRC